MSEDNAREEEVHDNVHGSLKTDRHCCPINVDENIEKWLAGV
jgi:hypothetical protein